MNIEFAVLSHRQKRNMTFPWCGTITSWTFSQMAMMCITVLAPLNMRFVKMNKNTSTIIYIRLTQLKKMYIIADMIQAPK